jgi:hypothetical protein
LAASWGALYRGALADDEGGQGERVEAERRSGESACGPGKVFLCLVAAWVVPGLGHLLLGRRGKALLYFALLTFTFLFGMWLADWRNVRTDDDFELYFFGEAFLGGLAFPALWLTRGLPLVEAQPRLDVGLLFSTVAGIMNLCVIVDVYETACPRATVPQPDSSRLPA